MLTAGIRLSANEIRTAIYEYGCTLILPPLSEYKTLDIIRIKDAAASSWSVRMNLWTQEEGKSDLSIELTIKEKDGIAVVEFDDIHVFYMGKLSEWINMKWITRIVLEIYSERTKAKQSLAHHPLHCTG
jgi:hypothetical protein